MLHKLRSRRGALVVAALAAFMLPALALAATPPPFKGGATYRAKTSQGNDCLVGSNTNAPCKISLKPYAQGKRMLIELRHADDCTNGQTFRNRFRVAFGPTPGLVRSNGSYTPLTADVSGPVGDTATYESRVVFNGRFIRNGTRYKARGGLQSTTTVTFEDASRLTCRSGRVTYLARP